MNQDDFNSQPFNGDPTGNIPMAGIAGGALVQSTKFPATMWGAAGGTHPQPLPEARVQLAETPPEVIRWALGLMTPNELAGALGVKEGTLSVWRSTGEGPKFIKLGKQVFYRLDDLSQWVWSKYPQIKNQVADPAAGDASVEQEVFPFVQHDEEAPKASGYGTTTPWMPPKEEIPGEGPTTGL